ncbi:MAG: VWA domain-containing protein, partial [Oscillospiraceae bacterium]|nr:VWA domain-containing protein [Oscillospiraceae bacterium]
MRKCIAFLAALVLLLSLPVAGTLATPDSDHVFVELGKKIAVNQAVPGQYEIQLSVPGVVDAECYSEIIIMVDASDSQGANFEKLKAMLINIGEQVLHDDGSIRLTLMGYGMGPRNVGSFYNVESLKERLATLTRDELLQGVSATNCEGALQFVYDYIQSSSKLHKAVVVFTSDGKTNMDETAYSLSEWQQHPEWWAKGVNAETIVSYAAGAQMELLLAEGIYFSGTTELYFEQCEQLEIAEELYGRDSVQYKERVDALYAAIMTDADTQAAYLAAVWKDVFSYSGLTYGSEAKYSTSQIEKAFLDFHDGALTNSFLLTIHRMVNAGFYPDWYNLSTWGGRAAAAADKLANSNKVTELYMVDFNNTKNIWMNPEAARSVKVTSDKIIYQSATSFAAAMQHIEVIMQQTFITPHNDVTVIDPMSKWVDLLPESIRIYDGETLIYEQGTGWLYADKRPAANPITLTQDAEGNYTITWRIKDGPLLYSDRYCLRYLVQADTDEPGFSYDTALPANDPTNVEFTDDAGVKHTEPIEVPNIDVPAPQDPLADADHGVRILKADSASGAPICGIVFDVYKLPEGAAADAQPTQQQLAEYAVAENLVAAVTTNSQGSASLNLT